jgi:hypothetical protein
VFAADSDRDFRTREFRDETCLFKIGRHEIVTYPFGACVIKFTVSFAQHFSELKFSSTSHEVESNNIAEIAPHKSSPRCNNRRTSTKPTFLLVFFDETAMEV